MNAIDSVKGIMNVDAVAAACSTTSRRRIRWCSPICMASRCLVPNLRERLRDMKSRGIAIAFNTNGLTLDDDLARFMVEIELDSISFSIDSVTRETLEKIRGVDKLEKIEAAVFRMLAARGDRDLPRISVSFTLQDKNRHEEAGVRRALERPGRLRARQSVVRERHLSGHEAAGEAAAMPDAVQDAAGA